MDLLEAYSYIKKSGAWISATEDFNELLAETPFDFPNPELTKYLFEFFKKDIQELSLE